MAADDERPGPGADPRTLALSDGVFAIAMTLLVLSIGMPRPGEHGRLGTALWHHRDELFSWLLSFVVIGAAWMRHRRLLASVHRVDPVLTRLNLAYLGAVAFLPYPTEVLGAYASRPAAVGLYAVTAALMSTAGGLMARHAHDAGLLWPHANDTTSSGGQWWLAPVILVLAIPLSLLLGAWALLIWLLLGVARRTGRTTVAS
jgi:uncharacterized membrane protein